MRIRNQSVAESAAIVVAMAWFLCMGHAISAQERVGTLRGVVRDISGRPIRGAEVIASGNSVTRTAMTNDQGQFRIENLQPGKYEVHPDKAGFKKQPDVTVTINAGSEQVQSFELTDSPPAKQARFWFGVSEYSMEGFNQLLSAERNNSILRGFSAGAEVSVFATPVPVLKGNLQLPIGVEYLAANSTTTHLGAGGSATVIWDLPAVGLFVAPVISVGSAERLYFHPGLGYYVLGHWKKAGLSVTDRSGQLNAKSSGPSMFAAIGWNQRIGDFGPVFVEGGYRYLKFTSVDTTAAGDFPSVLGGAALRGGALASPLDYSFYFVRFGFAVRLGAGV